MNGRQDNGAGGNEDAAFERYLDGDSRVSTRYAELGAELPPPELDARILAEAERTAKTVYLPLTGAARRWTAPVALAAVVLLSFSIVISVVTETPRSLYDDASLLTDAAGGLTAPGNKDGIEEIVVATRSSPKADVPPSAEQSDRLEQLRGEAESEMEILPQSRPPTARLADTKDLRGVEMLVLQDDTRAELARAVGIIREFLEVSPAAPGEAEIPALAASAPKQEIGQGASVPVRSSGGQSAPAGSDLVESDVVESALVDSGGAPDDLLTEILRAYDEGDYPAAGAKLDAFRRQHPDHPVSVSLRSEDPDR